MVEAADPATLDPIAIAIDRLISAVSEHADTGDALLDAVMAWENLFGSKEETTFKVTAALTILTVEEPRDRPETLKKLRATYSVRSKFVHAAKTLEPAEMAGHRDRAIDTGLGALRVLLRERPDLLARTSSERAEAGPPGLASRRLKLADRQGRSKGEGRRTSKSWLLRMETSSAARSSPPRSPSRD